MKRSKKEKTSWKHFNVYVPLLFFSLPLSPPPPFPPPVLGRWFQLTIRQVSQSCGDTKVLHVLLSFVLGCASVLLYYFQFLFPPPPHHLSRKATIGWSCDCHVMPCDTPPPTTPAAWRYIYANYHMNATTHHLLRLLVQREVVHLYTPYALFCTYLNI